MEYILLISLLGSLIKLVLIISSITVSATSTFPATSSATSSATAKPTVLSPTILIVKAAFAIVLAARPPITVVAAVRVAASSSVASRFEHFAAALIGWDPTFSDVINFIVAVLFFALDDEVSALPFGFWFEG